jgi:hypothetical protein
MIQLNPILKLRIKTMRILSELSSFLLSCISLGKNFDEVIGLLSPECQILNICREGLFNEFTHLLLPIYWKQKVNGLALQPLLRNEMKCSSFERK